MKRKLRRELKTLSFIFNITALNNEVLKSFAVDDEVAISVVDGDELSFVTDCELSFVVDSELLVVFVIESGFSSILFFDLIIISILTQ